MRLFSLGDIAFKMLDHAPLLEQSVDIVISDINQPMLDVGKKRAYKLGIAEGMIFKLDYDLLKSNSSYNKYWFIIFFVTGFVNF